MAKDFSKYMGGDASTIPTSLPYLPLGHYFGDFVKWENQERFYDKSNPKKGTVVVMLSFKVTGPDTDVDQEELNALYPDSQGVGELVTKDYDIQTSLKGKVMLRRMCEEYAGVSVNAGMELGDLLDSTVGSNFKLYNEPRQDPQNEGTFYSNIKQVLPASD